jgi:hypothetical protein
MDVMSTTMAGRNLSFGERGKIARGENLIVFVSITGQTPAAVTRIRTPRF